MGLFNEKNKLYRNQGLINFRKNNLKGIICFIISMLLTSFSFTDYASGHSSGLDPAQILFLCITFLWILLYKRWIDVEIKNVKEKYYPNGQIRKTSQSGHIGFTGGRGHRSWVNITYYNEDGSIKKLPIILKNHRVNFINWHPDTLVKEKSIDRELQGHLMHFELEYKEKVVILGVYHWSCEYKPNAWSIEEKWYFTNELEINCEEGQVPKFNMEEGTPMYNEKDQKEIIQAVKNILHETDLMEERGIENESLIGTNINI